jgi:hypothetical protein
MRKVLTTLLAVLLVMGVALVAAAEVDHDWCEGCDCDKYWIDIFNFPVSPGGELKPSTFYLINPGQWEIVRGESLNRIFFDNGTDLTLEQAGINYVFDPHTRFRLEIPSDLIQEGMEIYIYLMFNDPNNPYETIKVEVCVQASPQQIRRPPEPRHNIKIVSFGYDPDAVEGHVLVILEIENRGSPLRKGYMRVPIVGLTHSDSWLPDFDMYFTDIEFEPSGVFKLWRGETMVVLLTLTDEEWNEIFPRLQKARERYGPTLDNQGDNPSEFFISVWIEVVSLDPLADGFISRDHVYNPFEVE